MKKPWSAPAAELVRFAANEYCASTCRADRIQYTHIDTEGYLIFETSTSNTDGADSVGLNATMLDTYLARMGGNPTKGSKAYFDAFVKMLKDPYNTWDQHHLNDRDQFYYDTTSPVFNPNQTGLTHSEPAEGTTLYDGWWQQIRYNNNTPQGFGEWMPVSLWWQDDANGGSIHAATVTRS